MEKEFDHKHLITEWQKKITKLKSQILFLEGAIKHIRKSCPHKNTVYHERPCAEADSYDECLDCGELI